jgi:transposase-like protein
VGVAPPAGSGASTGVGCQFRFTLSYRDVEELLAERGVDVSYETVWRWVLKFGPAVARRLRERRPRPQRKSRDRFTGRAQDSGGFQNVQIPG